MVNVCSIHCRCNPKSVKEKGGAYCEVEIFEEISSDTGSQTTHEDSTGYVTEKCILKVMNVQVGFQITLI